MAHQVRVPRFRENKTIPYKRFFDKLDVMHASILLVPVEKEIQSGKTTPPYYRNTDREVWASSMWILHQLSYQRDTIFLFSRWPFFMSYRPKMLRQTIVTQRKAGNSCHELSFLCSFSDIVRLIECHIRNSFLGVDRRNFEILRCCWTPNLHFLHPILTPRMNDQLSKLPSL